MFHISPDLTHCAINLGPLFPLWIICCNLETFLEIDIDKKNQQYLLTEMDMLHLEMKIGWKQSALSMNRIDLPQFWQILHPRGSSPKLSEAIPCISQFLCINCIWQKIFVNTSIIGIFCCIYLHIFVKPHFFVLKENFYLGSNWQTLHLSQPCYPATEKQTNNNDLQFYQIFFLS